MRLVVRVVLVLALVGGGVFLGPSGGAAADQGPWDWPLTGPPPVARPFTPPATRYGSGHRGVDLAAPVGSPVRAAGSGVVGYAGLLAGRGVVTVVHGALRTTYEPVTASVSVGEAVSLGDELGVLADGHCPGGCLHWGLRRGEDYLDPLSLVGGPVRLLPLVGGGPGLLRGGGPVGAGASGASTARAPTEREAAAPPAERDDAGAELSLRSADAPLGLAALAALVAGVALLSRPRPRPRPDDPAPAAAAVAVRPPEPAEAGSPGELLDLEAARLRRRSAS